MGDRITNWLYGVMARPAPTLNEVAKEKPVGWALLVYLGVSLLSGSASIFGPGFGAAEEIMQEFAFFISPAVLIFGGLPFTIAALFVSTLLVHLFARLFGGTAGFWNLFSAYCFAGFPMIISVPVTLIGSLIGAPGAILISLSGFALAVWVLVLNVIAIRESHGLTTGMSILAYIIHLVILLIIPVVLVALIIAAIIAI